MKPSPKKRKPNKKEVVFGERSKKKSIQRTNLIDRFPSFYFKKIEEIFFSHSEKK